jgi:hypothetical protein
MKLHNRFSGFVRFVHGSYHCFGRVVVGQSGNAIFKPIAGVFMSVGKRTLSVGICLQNSKNRYVRLDLFSLIVIGVGENRGSDAK